MVTKNSNIAQDKSNSRMVEMYSKTVKEYTRSRISVILMNSL